MVSKASEDLPDPLTPGEDHELPVRQRQVDALEIVGAGAADDQRARARAAGIGRARSDMMRPASVPGVEAKQPS